MLQMLQGLYQGTTVEVEYMEIDGSMYQNLLNVS